MKTLKKLLFFLTPSERKQASAILVMIIIMAILDMIGVASILPFIAILFNPSQIETNLILNAMFKFSNNYDVVTHQQFLFVMGAVVFVLLIISLLFKAVTAFVQFNFVQNCDHSIGKRFLEGYLHQPYDWFLNRNSAEIGKNILSEVQQLIANGINPMMELIAKSSIIISLTILIFLVNPKIALITIGVFGFAYGLVFYFIRKILHRIGGIRLINNRLRFSIISEAFGAIKEVKIRGLEKFYVNKFTNPSKLFSQTTASSLIFAMMPRFILEATVFGFFLLIILYLFTKSDDLNSFLPIISMYVFAGYRLMPAFQQVYASFTQLAFCNTLLDKLYNDYKNLKNPTLNQDNDYLAPKKIITLNNICFSYPGTSKEILKNLNLTIAAKSFVGIIGATGSGKTTLIDIILGLLEAQNGIIKVDGEVITKQNLRSWQRSIGYVPQNIYLSDDTIAANIAFGIEPKDINHDIIEKAAEIANLHKFITDELPKQYQTIIGERGVRLSGGQCQRIGIARALYHNPQILIFDEATSALDNQTEQAVMNAVNKLGKDITIILITHRLVTTKKCDIIFKLENGRLVDQGSLNEIIN
jgi:ABC-type multidrug transport system fused ATPase/permease subunit